MSNLFKRLSMNTKFSVVPATLIAGGLTIAWVGVNKMRETNDSLAEITNVTTHRLLIAHQTRELFEAQTINEKNMILEDEPAEVKVRVDQIAKTDAEIHEKMEELFRISDEEEDKIVKGFEGAYAKWMDATKRSEAFSLKNDDKSAFAISKVEGRKYQSEGEEALLKLIEIDRKSMNNEVTEAETAYKNARNLMILIIVGSMAIGLLITYIVLSRLNRAITQVVDQLTDSSTQVAAASKQVAGAAEEFSSSTTEQASSLAETAASVEEINAMIQKNADNANNSKKYADEARESTKRGQNVVGDMIQAMATIHEANGQISTKVEESNNQISEIIRVVAEIGNKTKVINDIVFQTKLLSFNASVEAARAGEHGKGFAVVAEEVGNLAQMSGNAAKEITEMLDESIKRVEDIAEKTKQEVRTFMDLAKEKIDTGKEIADRCGTTLTEIGSSIERVSQASNEIAIASQEQASGVQEITKAMGQLDQVTQMNATATREISTAMESLSVQSTSMRGVVQTLIDTVKGERGGSPAPSALVAQTAP